MPADADEPKFDKRPLNLNHEKISNAEKVRQAQERRDAATAARAALWNTLTHGQQMRAVYGVSNEKNLLIEEEKVLRKLYNKDPHGYVREMLKYEAEEKNPQVVTPPASPAAGGEKPAEPEKPQAPDVGSRKALDLIEELLKECNR